MKKTGLAVLLMLLPLFAVAGGEEEYEKARSAYKAGHYSEAMQLFQAAAGKGHARAALNTGVLYMQGQGVAADKAQALLWFRKAADAGDPMGMFNTAMAYESGDGVAPSSKMARNWYESAALTGDLKAASRMVLVALPPAPSYTPPSLLPASFDEAFYKGLAASDRSDYAEAIKYWQYTAIKGREVSAMKNLGLLYYKGLGTPKNLVEAQRWWAEAAGLGNAEAMYYLGVINNFGEGTERDLRLARLWYGFARDKAYPAAAKALSAVEVDELLDDAARKYQLGNFTQARELFEAAAARGSTAAMINRGVMAGEGKGGEKNDKEALQWYQKAADANDPAGMQALAKMYWHGAGVARNDAEAVNWLRRAQAATTDANERQTYETQIEFISNAGRTEKFKATEKSALNGNYTAMLQLGLYYREGEEGAPKDRERALQWLEGAGHAGQRQAMSQLKAMYRGDVDGGAYKDKKRLAFWEKQSQQMDQAQAAREQAELSAYLRESERKNHEYRMQNDPAYRSQIEYQKGALQAGSGNRSTGAFQDAFWQQNSWNNGGRNLGGGMYSSQRTTSTGDRVIEIKFK